MVAELKYKVEISEFACDLALFKEYNARQAFRWVFEDINDVRNFAPIFMNPAAIKKDCRGWALSFYEESSQAIARIKELARGRPTIYKKVGTHLATGILATKDGISDEPNGIGHFDHFEYINVDLKNKFSIVESLL
jgi:hypothetical protein